jgi:hypothetical protein
MTFRHSLAGAVAVLVIALTAQVLAQDALDPAALAAGRQLVHVTRPRMQLDTLEAQLVALFFPLMEKNAGHPFTAQERQQVQAALISAVKTVFTPDMWDDVLGRLYAKYYTTEEMTELQRFYESSLGQKYLAIAGQLAADAVKASAEIVQARQNQLLEVFRQELEALRRQ